MSTTTIVLILIASQVVLYAARTPVRRLIASLGQALGVPASKRQQ
jgi:hypothetical protein